MSRVGITAILAGIRALAGRRALVPKYDDPDARACYCRGMIKIPAHAATALSLALLLGACASGPQRSATEAPMFTSERSSDHRDGDDLLTAGLGLRSEEHTSELQSLMRTSYAVFCLKNKNQHTTIKYTP